MKPIILCALILGVFLLLPGQAFAASYYVATSGNDTNPGTQSLPWKTIQKCLDAVIAGDTCEIMGGTYYEALTLKTSGTLTARITVKNFNNQPATVNSQNSKTLVTGGRVDYYTLDGLRFIANFTPADQSDVSIDLGKNVPFSTTNSSYGNHGYTVRNCYIEGAIHFYGHGNVLENCELNGKNIYQNGLLDNFAASHDNTYRNNRIYNYPTRGIWTMNGTDNILIEGNTIHDVTHGIDCDGASVPITRCRVINNHTYNLGSLRWGSGIFLEDCFDCYIQGNTIHDIQTGPGIFVENYGNGSASENWHTLNNIEYRNQNTNTSIVGNVIYNYSTDAGMSIKAANGLLIDHNTVHHSGTRPAIGFSRDNDVNGVTYCSQNETVTNDILFKNGATWFCTPAAISTQLGNVLSDPSFVNPPLDLHLAANSPACTAGIGGTYAGAYPCGSVSTPTPTPIPPVYYVSTSGNDANPGTQSQPWRTIQKAANSLVAGDTVNVISGIYATDLVSTPHITITRSGSAGAPITYNAVGDVRITGFTLNADYIAIKGFNITSLSNDYSNGRGVDVNSGSFCDIENNTISFSTWGGIKLNGTPAEPAKTHDCIIKNNQLYRNGQMGIEVKGTNHLIEGNEVSESVQHHPCNISHPSETWLDADGMHFHGSGHTFRGNYIHDISYDAVGLSPAHTCTLANLEDLRIDYNDDPHIDCFQTLFDPADKEPGSDTVFEQNVCFNEDAYQARNIGGKGFQQNGASNDLVIKNNLFKLHGIGQFNDATNLTLVNNTFIGHPDFNGAVGIYLTRVSHAVIQNNIFAYQENGIGSIWPDAASVQTLTAGYNCVYRNSGRPSRAADPEDVWNQNPMFTDETAGNYHLQPQSPCINAGLTIAGVTNDLDGIIRPQGSAYDIGAYEYPTALTPTPPPPAVKPGDANGDNVVDGRDYTVWVGHYNQSLTGPSNGDFDGNSTVDGRDYSLWLNNYGR